MKIMSWNCQGLGNQRAVDVLSHLVREKVPKILFLMETKQSISKMKQIQAGLPYRCMFVVLSIREVEGWHYYGWRKLSCMSKLLP